MSDFREHIGLLGDFIADAGELSPIEGEWLATALLTSTDPAVLDAMQDALLRSGRLHGHRAEWGIQRPAPYEGVLHDEMYTRESAELSRNIIRAGQPGEWSVVSRQVFVTDWTEVTS